MKSFSLFAILCCFFFSIPMITAQQQNCCITLSFNVLTPKGEVITDTDEMYKIQVFTQENLYDRKEKEKLTYTDNKFGHKYQKSFYVETRECNLGQAKIIIKKRKKKMIINIAHLMGAGCEHYNITAIPFKKGTYHIDLTTQVLSKQYSWNLAAYTEIPFYNKFYNLPAILTTENKVKEINQVLKNDLPYKQCYQSYCRKAIDVNIAELPKSKATCYREYDKLFYILWQNDTQKYQIYLDEKQNVIDLKGEKPQEFPIEKLLSFLNPKA